MHMPGMDGLELAAAIKPRPGLATLRLVMLTSLAAGDEARSRSERGIVAYLTKPVRQQELVNDCRRRRSAARGCSGDGAPGRGAASHSLRTPARRSRRPGCAGVRVLLVEDNPVNQEVARGDARRAWAATWTIAGNGREAVEAMARERFNLVLMDCQMPEMDGFEAVRRLRDPVQAEVMQTPRDVPVVAITANALAGDAERCRAAGFSDYLAKPFKQQQLAEMVQRWAPAAGARSKRRLRRRSRSRTMRSPSSTARRSSASATWSGAARPGCSTASSPLTWSGPSG